MARPPRPNDRPKQQSDRPVRRVGQQIRKPVVELPPVRLNRYLAQAGICARRKADELISGGRVKVNEVVVTELGTKIIPGKDRVAVDGKEIRAQNLVYVLLNKPKNHLTTAHDPNGRRTVMDLVAKATTERIYPVGRLDRNTTGVLLLTNDGELAKKLAHPSGGVKKLYHVRLGKPLTEVDLVAIREGVQLEDGLAEIDEVGYLDPDDLSFVAITLHSGRNRVVRRIFEHLGYSVEALDRIAFGPLTKKGLRRGHFRLLDAREVGYLKML